MQAVQAQVPTATSADVIAAVKAQKLAAAKAQGQKFPAAPHTVTPMGFQNWPAQPTQHMGAHPSHMPVPVDASAPAGAPVTAATTLPQRAPRAAPTRATTFAPRPARPSGRPSSPPIVVDAPGASVAYGGTVEMTGPAVEVFTARIDLAAIGAVADAATVA